LAKRGWYILGTGNFALEVFDWSQDAGLARESFLGFLGSLEGVAPRLLGYQVQSEDKVSFGAESFIVNAISTPATKTKVIESLRSRENVHFKTVVHPSATVKSSKIGLGSLVCPHCVVGPFSELGDFVTLNYHTGIGHESKLGCFSTTAPGVQVGGNSEIGRASYLGMNATVIDRVKIGNEAIVNAGSVVIGRVIDGRRVSGNPAKKTVTF
jgi:sugar O-acyltransferase (sialic acid O-acetyltransferase NeuD family)